MKIMKIIRDYQFVNTSDRGASVAVGNFDGVHLGHQHVIEIARAWGKKNKSPLGVLTFDRTFSLSFLEDF